MIKYVILLLMQSGIRAINDSIIHHDSYKTFGFFFTRKAAEQNKKNWFHKYFPMFYDFWHLGIVLQSLCVVGVVFVATQSILLCAIILFFQGIVFNIIYK